MSRCFGFLIAVFVLCGSVCASIPAYAQSKDGAVLFVAPHRLIIPSGERVDVLSVSNNSSEPRRYDLALIDQVMSENGVTERRDTFPYSIRRMVRFVPKRFSLKPGEQQTVRVMVSRPKDLADGDYHSHLLFREVPLSVKDKAQLKQERAGAESSLSFEIRTLYGIAVPIVVQHGKIVSEISVGDMRIGKVEGRDQKQLEVQFTRSGNAEAAAKVTAAYVAAGKEPVPLIDAQWVRLYREVDSVRKAFALNNLPDGAQGGKIVLSMIMDESDDSKTVKKEIAF